MILFLKGGDPLCASTQALDVRIGVSGNLTRFLIELSEQVQVQTKIEKNGKAIHVTLEKPIDWSPLSKKPKRSFGLVKRYLYKRLDHKKQLFSIFSDCSMEIQKIFWLKDPVTQNQRLILDLKESLSQTEKKFWKELESVIDERKALKRSVQETKTPKQNAPEQTLIPKYNVLPLPKPRAPSSTHSLPFKQKIILIDPGHGGQDPGTISCTGVYEKDLALQIGFLVRETLLKSKRYIVKMTREEDQFLPLRDRLAFAREVKADLVISLHADSSPKPDNRGASLYLLSDEASDAEAEALATKENKADIIHGVNMSATNKDINNILIDLAQRDTLNLSLDFAKQLHQEMVPSVDFIQKPIRFADLAVLKAPDIPSILIELGCISNKEDDRLLKMPKHRLKIAQALLRALDRFFGYSSASVNVKG